MMAEKFMIDRRMMPFLLIAAVAIALRIAAFQPFAIHHPDEALQYLEQAHRLAFGTGLVPWEYRVGMRSWLVPVLLAGPMALGKMLAPGSLVYLVLARAFAASLAFAPVIAAWAIGRRASRAHALVAMAVIAIWYESVYFSVHVLTEPLAVAAFLSAAAIAVPGASRRRLIVGGALLMLAAILRIQYAPAIAVFALVAFRLRWRDWRWLAAGGLLAAAASSAIDLVMGQWPFAWAWANVQQNVVANKAAEFGELGIDAYNKMLWLHWQLAMVPILLCAMRGARRSPALAMAALVNLVVHLAIGHKEYRFILLTGEITILLAAIGSVDLVERLRGRVSVRAVIVALIASWGIASAALATSDVTDLGWHRFESGNRLARKAALRPACGVALVDGSYWATGGQTYLDRIPLYYILGRNASAERAQFAATAQAYDAIIAAPDRSTIPANYRRLDCSGEGSERLCLAVRDGGCRRDAASDARLMQRMMEANGR
jgi:phosphatidylinositol glycan class B